MRRRAAAAVVVAAALLVVTACGDDDGGGGDAGGGGTGAGALAGRTFVSEEVVGRVLVAGTEVRLSFHDDGRVVATAGCNTMSGAYAVDGDRLEVADLAVTEMGCDPPRHEQDAWLGELLLGGPAAALAGDRLELDDGAGTVLRLLDREVADPDRPVEGTSWQLDGLVSGDGPDASVSSVPAGAATTVRFVDGTVEVAVERCNRAGGPATVGDGEIELGDVLWTLVLCEEPARSVESHVARVLASGTTVAFEVEAASLTIRAGSGKGIVLHAAE